MNGSRGVKGSRVKVLCAWGEENIWEYRKGRGGSSCLKGERCLGERWVLVKGGMRDVGSLDRELRRGQDGIVKSGKG